MTSPYEVLGVPEGADLIFIKAAWRRLMAQHHPDRGGDAVTATAINDAYAALTDPVRRLKFDSGRDDTASIETAAWQNAAAAIAKAVEQACEASSVPGYQRVITITASAERFLLDMHSNIKAAQADAKRRRAALMNLRSRVISKADTNLVDGYLNKELAKLDVKDSLMAEDAKVCAKALGIVRKHKDVLPEPTAMTTWPTPTSSTHQVRW